MSDITTKLATDKFLIRGSIVFFAVNMGIAYLFYPHWVTFSYLALQTYALPFFLTAMAVTIFLLWHTGKRQWVWVVLQVFVTSLLMLSLLRIFSTLEKRR